MMKELLHRVSKPGLILVLASVSATVTAADRNIEAAFSALWAKKTTYPQDAKASLVNGVDDPAGLHRRMLEKVPPSEWSKRAQAVLQTQLDSRGMGYGAGNYYRVSCSGSLCEVVVSFEERQLKKQDASVEQDGFRSSILQAAEALNGEPYVAYVGGPNAGPSNRLGVSMLGYVEQR